jgi:hypothetical protein
VEEEEEEEEEEEVEEAGRRGEEEVEEAGRREGALEIQVFVRRHRPALRRRRLHGLCDRQAAGPRGRRGSRSETEREVGEEK